MNENDRRKPGRTQGDTRRGPKVFRVPRGWRAGDIRREVSERQMDTMKVKLRYMGEGLWQISYIWFLTDTNQEFMNFDHYKGILLREVGE